MKYNINKIQVYLGSFLVFIVLICGTFGAYQLFMYDATEVVTKIGGTFSDLRLAEFSDGESAIFMANSLSYVETSILIIKTNLYNFILGNFLVLLFGLHFIFSGLRKK